MSEIFPLRGSINADIKVDAAPLVQAAADVVTSLNKGGAKVLNALFGKWIAKNEHSIALLRAQTEKDCVDIGSGRRVYREGELLHCPTSATIAGVYDALHTLNHMSDARRLQAAVEETIRQLARVPSGEISDEPLSQTFFNRWRREAEAIDDVELREWWAGLLKEEAVHPNRVSMRTLDVVKNLSKEDGLRFVSLCRGAVCGELIVNYDNWPIFGSYEDVVYFQDLGLVSNLQSSAKMKPDDGEEAAIVLLSGRRMALRIMDGLLWVHTFSLTCAGRDVMRVLGEQQVTEDETNKICNFAMSHNIDSCKVEAVCAEETNGVKNQCWIRGHRPTCFE